VALRVEELCVMFEGDCQSRYAVWSWRNLDAGALSIAALFNNCVELFEYIQLGRQFEPDFARSRLTLDICKTQLSR
jgi:hypothetical protein